MILKTEKDVKTAVRKWLSQLNVFWYMPSASIYGKSGIPDFICCVKGHFIAIETKSQKTGLKGLTPLQKKCSREIINSGGDYFCVCDNETINYMMCIVEQLLEDEEKTLQASN
jgi:hypothetical protein